MVGLGFSETELCQLTMPGGIYQECRKAIEQRKTIQPRLLMKKIEQHYLEHYKEKTTD